MTRASRWRTKLTEVTSMLVLGLGLVLLFEPTLAPIDFWVVWIVGFAVVVPMVELLLDVEEDIDEDAETDSVADADRESDRTDEPGRSRREAAEADVGADTRDAIETLRERYARGDLTDEQFERKLDRLLRTDTPENAAEWRDRARPDPQRSAATNDRDHDTESGDPDRAEPGDPDRAEPGDPVRAEPEPE